MSESLARQKSHAHRAHDSAQVRRRADHRTCDLAQGGIHDKWIRARSEVPHDGVYHVSLCKQGSDANQSGSQGPYSAGSSYDHRVSAHKGCLRVPHGGQSPCYPHAGDDGRRFQKATHGARRVRGSGRAQYHAGHRTDDLACDELDDR